MIALDSTLLTLQAVLASAANTTQPFAHVWYYDTPGIASDYRTVRDRLSMQRTALNNTTAVDICAAPSKSGISRQISELAIVNRSADTEIVTIQTTDGSTVGPIITQTLLTLESLHYNEEEGFYVMGA